MSPVDRRAIILPAEFPRIVCICGSRRFAERMRDLALVRTICGEVVLMPHVVEHEGIDSSVKKALDELHLRKIDLADYVWVVTDETAYIGESTKREIEYALAKGKYVQVDEPLGSIWECSPSHPEGGFCGIHKQLIAECDRDFRDDELRESETDEP